MFSEKDKNRFITEENLKMIEMAKEEGHLARVPPISHLCKRSLQLLIYQSIHIH